MHKSTEDMCKVYKIVLQQNDKDRKKRKIYYHCIIMQCNFFIYTKKLISISSMAQKII